MTQNQMILKCISYNVSIKAFRAYIKVPTTVASASGASLRSIEINFEGTTGIQMGVIVPLRSYLLKYRLFADFSW